MVVAVAVAVALALVSAIPGWGAGGGALPVSAAAAQSSETDEAAGDAEEAAEAECAVPAAADGEERGTSARGTARAERPAPRIAARSAATPAAVDPEAALLAELTATARALAACLSDGEAETVVELATDGYLGQIYGGGPPLPEEDYLALAPDLDRVRTEIRSVRDAERDGDEATAEVISVVGRQLLRGRWTFVLDEEGEEGNTPWRVDAEEPLRFEPPDDANPLAVAIEEYAIGVEEATVAGPNVVLRGRNAGAEDHEMLVLRFGAGTASADLLREPGPGLPRGVTYVGQATVPAGERAELVLVDLAPGAYAIVCLFPTDRGTPHLALGMEAAFTVGR